MAMRSVVVSLRSSMAAVASRTSIAPRYFSSEGGDGRILGDEERAKETVYIRKMEREQFEKIKKKLGYVEKEGEDLLKEINEQAEIQAKERAEKESQKDEK